MSPAKEQIPAPRRGNPGFHVETITSGLAGDSKAVLANESRTMTGNFYNLATAQEKRGPRRARRFVIEGVTHEDSSSLPHEEQQGPVFMHDDRLVTGSGWVLRVVVSLALRFQSRSRRTAVDTAAGK